MLGEVLPYPKGFHGTRDEYMERAGLLEEMLGEARAEIERLWAAIKEPHDDPLPYRGDFIGNRDDWVERAAQLEDALKEAKRAYDAVQVRLSHQVGRAEHAEAAVANLEDEITTLKAEIAMLRHPK